MNDEFGKSVSLSDSSFKKKLSDKKIISLIAGKLACIIIIIIILNIKFL